MFWSRPAAVCHLAELGPNGNGQNSDAALPISPNRYVYAELLLEVRSKVQRQRMQPASLSPTRYLIGECMQFPNRRDASRPGPDCYCCRQAAHVGRVEGVCLIEPSKSMPQPGQPMVHVQAKASIINGREVILIEV